ncbi:MAG: C40 family peptidase [Proteobacteria bacterium]|nr:C40 family peptidase [Pseudomonadota bacterium]MBU1739966.1 C40 family peptidase [Pseudomonadota bacterium]
MNKKSRTAILAALAVALIGLAGCGKSDIHGYGDGRRDWGRHGTAGLVVAYARSYIGLPYRYGGSDPHQGFDCSGLIQHAYARFGVRIPRTARDQFRHGRPVSRRRLRPGDLVFFWSRRTKWHVGLYMGRGFFVHSPRTGAAIRVDSLNRRYYRRRFQGARRVVQGGPTYWRSSLR